MGFFSALFSSNEIVKKTVDLVDDSVRGVGNWIDEQDFTEQERATAAQKLLNLRLKVLERTTDESSVRSISRRVIAWAVVASFLIVLFTYTIGAALNAKWADAVLDALTLLHGPFLAVLSFYFVSHIGNSWIDRVKNSKSDTDN